MIHSPHIIVPLSHCLIRFGLLGFPEHKARKTKYNYDQRWSIFFVLGHGVEIYENRSRSTRENTAFLRIGARVEWSNNVSRGPALCMIHCITFKLLGEMYQMINLRENFDSERKLLSFRPNVFWFVIRPSHFGLPHIGLRWPWYWSGHSTSTYHHTVNYASIGVWLYKQRNR